MISRRLRRLIFCVPRTTYWWILGQREKRTKLGFLVSLQVLRTVWSPFRKCRYNMFSFARTWKKQWHSCFDYHQIRRTTEQSKRNREELETCWSRDSSIKDFLPQESQQRLQYHHHGLVRFHLLCESSFCTKKISSLLVFNRFLLFLARRYSDSAKIVAKTLKVIGFKN